MTDLRKAAEMALEALEFGLKADELPSGGHWDNMANEAITALRQAIQEAALQKLTDIHQEMEQKPVAWWNPDESGLSFQKLRGDWQPLYAAPVHAIDINKKCVDETAKDKHDPNVYGDGNVYRGVRSKDSQTKTMYCKAGECDWCMLESTQESLREHMAEIKRLRAELEQAEKVEPDGFIEFKAKTFECLRLDKHGFHYKGQVIEDAGEAYCKFNEWMSLATFELKEKQEPVAWKYQHKRHKMFEIRGERRPVFDPKYIEETPLYTASPRREWVGLTDAEAWEEWVKAVDSSNHSDRLLAFRYLRAIEAKLREKNT